MHGYNPIRGKMVMLLSQRLVWVKELSTLAATFLHTASWGLDWFAEQHHITQIWSVLWSNTKTQATSARGLQLTAESRAEPTHLNPWNEKTNTLAVWVISSPSHVHYGSRGEFLMCLCLGFIPTQSGEPPFSLTAAHSKDSSISAPEHSSL